MSSFSGLIVFQQLVSDLDLKRTLSRCFEHQKGSPSFSISSIVLILIVSMLLGYRRLRHVQFFKDDPVVLRLLGLHHMNNCPVCGVRAILQVCSSHDFAVASRPAQDSVRGHFLSQAATVIRT